MQYSIIITTMPQASAPVEALRQALLANSSQNSIIADISRPSVVANLAQPDLEELVRLV